MFDFSTLGSVFEESGIGDAYGDGIDTDGDGLEDTYAYDTDGDGAYDTYVMDTDGDGIIDTEMYFIDTDGDGTADMAAGYADTDGDGIAETYFKLNDYDQDGSYENARFYTDTDGDGTFDVMEKLVDTDGDGEYDLSETYVDEDGDGEADSVWTASDDDGSSADDESDGSDAGETGDGDGQDISGSVYATVLSELEQFDPDSADADDVAGDPESSMEVWEYQGSTNRCALYSQKFVIEELTGEDIDIEDFADIAEENEWFTEEGGTSLLNMNRMLDYYGVDNEMSFNNDISDIEECLEDGGKVIVSIDADEIWYGEDENLFDPADSANHAVEVIGIDYSDPDNPMVILNDSGTSTGQGEMVPLDTFMDAWEDGDYQMVACG